MDLLAHAAQLGSELMLSLNTTTTIKVRRTRVEKTADGYVWHGKVVDLPAGSTPI